MGNRNGKIEYGWSRRTNNTINAKEFFKKRA